MRVTRILLLEDDAGTATEILLELAVAGHQALHRTTLAGAADAMRESAIDAMIVDRQLPDGDVSAPRPRCPIRPPRRRRCCRAHQPQ